jgi:predicted nucleic acid-binding protein
MIVLDTNLISEVMRPRPETRVLSWLDRQPMSSIWTTAVSVFEIRCGLSMMATGQKRSALTTRFEQWLAGVVGSRILSFDEIAAEHAAEVTAERKARGRPGEARDTMIAGIVLANHATLATRNVKHFEDIGKWVVNPWESSA